MTTLPAIPARVLNMKMGAVPVQKMMVPLLMTAPMMMQANPMPARKLLEQMMMMLVIITLTA